MIKIVIDDKIPFIRGVFEKVGCEVCYLPGEKITSYDVVDADAIITRTRTICNEALLSGSKVKCIATATIGYDHIDTLYCQKNNIIWSNAAGCNATAVQQYMGAALVTLARKKGFSLKGKTLAIIGVGHTGKLTAILAKKLGMNLLLIDPPRSHAEGNKLFSSMDEVYEKADLICFHVPLTFETPYSTYHQANANFFKKVKNGIVLINASRGEVVDTQSLIDAIDQKIVTACALDVWENEPNISRDLLNRVDIATPHIAGYSAEGKRNGTILAIKAISKVLHLGLDDFEVEALPVVDSILMREGETLEDFILHTYDITRDDDILRLNSNDFENLRGKYKFRRDLSSYFGMI